MTLFKSKTSKRLVFTIVINTVKNNKRIIMKTRSKYPKMNHGSYIILSKLKELDKEYKLRQRD